LRQLLRWKEAGHSLNASVLTESLNRIVKAHAVLAQRELEGFVRVVSASR
jgi:hypothetical protein